MLKMALNQKLSSFFGCVCSSWNGNGVFFSENDRLQLFLKEEKVGHNTLGWISIELLIRSILRIFFSFFNNVTEIVEGVYFWASLIKIVQALIYAEICRKWTPFFNLTTFM